MYLESQLVRVSRNALVWSAVILALLAAWLAHEWRSIANAFSGPYAISAAALADERTLDRATRFFVAVTPDDDGVEVGTAETTTDGKTTVTARFVAAKCGGVLLLMKQPPKGSHGRQVGVLTAVPADVATKIYDPVVAGATTAGLRVLPFMLDASGDFKWLVMGWLAFGVVAGVLAIWWMIVAISRLRHIASHPVMQSLARRYPAEHPVMSIDQEIGSTYGAEGPKGTALTNSWLVHPSHLQVAVYRLADLTWVYKRVTRHSVNFVPTGKTYAVVIHDRTGRAHEIPCNRREKKADELLVGIVQRVPGIRAGFSNTEAPTTRAA